MTGLHVVSRLVGVLIAALAVQFICGSLGTTGILSGAGKSGRSHQQGSLGPAQPGKASKRREW